MILSRERAADLLERSVQINDGFTQTSADGINMVFDQKYGIMFCLYMPGMQGHYGESRGKISLSYFPASQPTNIRFVTISSGNAEYVPNIISLGEGKVRLLYEKDSREEGDHRIYYKDFDFLTESLSDEQTVKVVLETGKTTDLTESVQFAYLEAHGYHNHKYVKSEQICIGGHTIFRHDDGYLYGAISSYCSEVILYRSIDHMATLEFFAICPEAAQYEFDYKILNGRIYAIFRTDRDRDAISYIYSDDMGKSWSRPYILKNSIQCRPRMILYHQHILMSYNYFNDDTGNRPQIQQGRTSVRIRYGDHTDPEQYTVVADLYSKYGLVNICLTDIMNDVYMGFSTSELALEFHNSNPMVRGKDAVRFVKLGDLTP